MKNNPIFAKYRRIQQTKCTYAKRYKDESYYKDDYQNFNKKANEFKKNIKNGTSTIEAFDKWLDSQDRTRQE